MLDPADILVHRQPGIGGGLVGRSVREGRDRVKQVAKYQDESTKVSIVSVSRRASAPHFRACAMLPGGVPVEGIAGFLEIDILGQGHGQLFFRHRNGTAAVAMDSPGFGQPQ